MSIWQLSNGFFSVVDTAETSTISLTTILNKLDRFTFTVSGMVDSNVQYVNDVRVSGTGIVGDEWGPA